MVVDIPHAVLEADLEEVQINSQNSIELLMGKILLKLSAKFNVSEAAINFLTESLLGALINCEACSTKEIVDSLHTLCTTFKRKRFFSKYLNYVAPEELYIASEERHVRNVNGVYLPKQMNCTFQYINVRQTLTALFSNNDFFTTFFSEKKSTDGFIRCHRDSSHFAEHPFLKKISICC